MGVLLVDRAPARRVCAGSYTDALRTTHAAGGMPSIRDAAQAGIDARYAPLD